MKRKLSSVLVVLTILFTMAGSSYAGCTQAIPTSYKNELMQGMHTFATAAACTAAGVPWSCCTGSGAGATCAVDTFKIALYTTAAATLGAATAVYTTTGELATANGYTQGGATLANCAITTDGTTAYFDCTTDPSWATSTITADCFMVYNSSKANRAIYIGTFASTSSTNGTFTVTLPAPAAATGLIRVQ